MDNKMGARDARYLEITFARFTVQQLLEMPDLVIKDYISKATLNSTQTHYAMQAVHAAQKRQYTRAGKRIEWGGKRIEERSNLSPEQTNPSRLPAPPRTPVHRHLREEYIVNRPPPQPESPRSPVQRY